MHGLITAAALGLLASDPLVPIRVLAGIALLATIFAFIYVLRHLRSIETKLVAENLVPSELGSRNNLVLMVCLIPLIVTGLRLFLVRLS